MKMYVTAIACIMFLISCKPHTIIPESVEPEATNGKPWYYFSDQGIHAVSSPRSIPARSFVPWTEAVRVSDVAVLPDGPVFLINRLGVMAPGSQYIPPVLAEDRNFFPGQTAAGFVLTGDYVAIHLYRNSFFSQTAGTSGDDYLIRYSPVTATFSPLARTSNLGLPPESQCSGLEYAEDRWYAAFKVQRDNRTEFVYRSFSTLPPEQAIDPSGSETLEAAVYQEAVMPRSWGALPEQLRTLLTAIPESTPLSIRLYPAGRGTTRTYIRDGEGNYREGYAYIHGSEAAVLFSDGTLFLDRNGMKAYKLPPLSGGYRYTGFLVSGTVLLAAWEEQRFYETGRAGILEIPLPNEVY